jgi:hypothetical protein
VIRGSEDAMVGDADSRELAAEYGGGAELVTLEAGHIPRVEERSRERFWSIVLGFAATTARADHVEVRRRDQCDQPRDEVERVEHDRVRTVAPSSFEAAAKIDAMMASFDRLD